jgi:transcriptional regulator with XRE-family HTH domain
MKKVRSYPMKFDVSQFANDVSSRRAELGLNTREVGELAELAASLVSRYENALEDNMHLQNFLKFCNVYDIDPRKYFVLDD